MKPNTHRTTIVLILAVLILILTFFAIKYLAATQNKATLEALEQAVANQEVVLLKLSDLTRANGSDTATQRIIVDCAPNERKQFDALLDSLSGAIKPTELNELDTLFYKCGGFYADTKSVMATRLVREVEVYSEYQKLRSVLRTNNDTENKQLIAWRELAEAELKTAESFNKLVQLQGTIISQLRSGKPSTAPEIVSTLGEVSNVRGQMLMLSKQIEEHKKEASSL